MPGDWYPDTKNVPWPLDVLLCQRASAVWGRRGHNAYALVLLATAAVVLVAGIIIALCAHLLLVDYLIRLFLPSIPVLLDMIDLGRQHLHTSKLKGQIESSSDALWRHAAASGFRMSVSKCRDLQDATFRLRMTAPRVANWFYLLNRTRDDADMHAAVALRVEEYSSSSSS